jgi:hypothetical protein
VKEKALSAAGREVDGALGEDSLLVRMRPQKWLSNDQSET